VRFLFGDTDLDQNFEDFLALYLEFSGQVINSNLVLHYAPFPPLCFPPGLRLHSILTVRLISARISGGRMPARATNNLQRRT
jgi:hypothetical protein